LIRSVTIAIAVISPHGLLHRLYSSLPVVRLTATTNSMATTMGSPANHSPERRRRSKKRTQQCHPKVLKGRQEGNNGNYSQPPETSHIPQPPSRSQE
jgi:hypothetical protein